MRAGILRSVAVTSMSFGGASGGSGIGDDLRKLHTTAALRAYRDVAVSSTILDRSPGLTRTSRVRMRHGMADMTSPELWITAVAHLDSGPIWKVCAFQAKPGRYVQKPSAGDVRPLLKSAVVKALKGGEQFYTCTPCDDPRLPDHYKRGARVYEVQGYHITTDRNDTTRDNLGNLPDCNC